MKYFTAVFIVMISLFTVPYQAISRGDCPESQFTIYYIAATPFGVRDTPHILEEFKDVEFPLYCGYLLLDNVKRTVKFIKKTNLTLYRLDLCLYFVNNDATLHDAYISYLFDPYVFVKTPCNGRRYVLDKLQWDLLLTWFAIIAEAKQGIDYDNFIPKFNKYEKFSIEATKQPKCGFHNGKLAGSKLPILFIQTEQADPVFFMYEYYDFEVTDGSTNK